MSTSNLRNILAFETDRILSLSRFWQHVLDDTDDIPEEIAGRIRAQIGLSKLLVKDKFQQFVGLLDTYDNGNADMQLKMHIADLEGFWDLIYLQVEDTIKKFESLSALQQNQWREADDQKITKKKRQPLTSIANRTPNGHNEHAAEARKRIAQARLRMQQSNLSSSSSKYITENNST